MVAEADVAMVTSYCPDGIDGDRSGPRRAARRAGLLRSRHAGDAGAPRSRREPRLYRPARACAISISCSATPAARALDRLRARLGARRVAPLYGHVDPEIHRPMAARPDFAADLSYLGTYAADRQAALEALFIEPARRRPDRRFLIGGAQYPADFPWTTNIFFVRHLPPADHPAFFSSSPPDAQRHPSGDGRDGLVPVGPPVRGGGLRRRDADRCLGGARRLLRARPRDPRRALRRRHDRGARSQRSRAARDRRGRRASARWPSTPPTAAPRRSRRSSRRRARRAGAAQALPMEA